MKNVILLSNLVVALVLGGAITAQSLVDRQQTLEDGFVSAENLTQALAQHTRQVADTLEVGLGTLVEQFQDVPIDDPANAERLHQLLANRQADSALTYAYYVLDADGQLVATSRTADPEPVDLSGMPDFQDARDSDSDNMSLGVPRTGTVGFSEGQRVVTVSRRLLDADGEFAGMVAAAVSLDYMLEFYDSLRRVPGDVVGLLDSEGVVIVRSPDSELAGTQASGELIYESMEQEGSTGRFIGRLADLGQPDRLITYELVPTRTLTVYVGLDVASVLASWRERMYFKVFIGLLAMGLFAGASFLVFRFLRDRDQALHSLASSKREIETIFTSISDGVVVLDRDWCFTYLNDEAERILQSRADELLGRNMWEAFPEGVDSLAYSEYHRAVESGEPARFTLYFAPLSAHLDVRAFPYENGLTLYFQDITERVEMDERLRQAQKMEAVGQLTGGVAHDFNNLLTVILGNAESMVEELDAIKPGDRRMELVKTQADMIRQAGTRASQLTHRLLAFARKQPLNPRLTNINRLIGDTEGLLRRTLTESINIELVRGSGLWEASVDPNELQNALLNLAINARDAMISGGRLTIETANMSVDMDYARMHGLRAGQYVTVAVSDTGTGMDAATVDRVFDPFFTTKSEGKGSGLGLSMVYGFARQSGGQVKIYSEPGHGTTVRLYLPRAAAGEQENLPDEPVADGTEPLPEGDERILVVEDDEMVRHYTVSSLKRLGYRVEACPEARPALDALRDNGPFDLLLTDVVLTGGMSGRELVDQAMPAHPELKVLYMSGYTENAIVHHGRLDRGVHLLNKPFRITHLARKVREVIDMPDRSASA
ncbi:MAG: ATP-binding protein [Pseudohongiellaceae bacterium]